jgi:hypothetical protein
VALLVAIFVMTVTAAIVVLMLETQVSQMAALRHTAAYERANYLAAAATHHALAELEADPSWRTGIPSTEFPAGSGQTYSATVAAIDSSTVVVTATGNASNVARKLQVTVQLGDW